MEIQHLVNGGTVWVQGYEFIVCGLRVVESGFSRVSYGPTMPEIQGPGVPVAEFVGVLTDNPCNDSIRGTSYDGATYGGNARVYTWRPNPTDESPAGDETPEGVWDATAIRSQNDGRNTRETEIGRMGRTGARSGEARRPADDYK